MFSDLPPIQPIEMLGFLPAELQDVLPSNPSDSQSLEIPNFLATEPQIYAPTEIPALRPAQTIYYPTQETSACPPAHAKTSMPTETIDIAATVYQPDTPTSVGLNTETGRRITYADAVSHKNVLMCLPRRVRKRIYTYLLADYPEVHNIEIPETGDFSKAFPDFCHSLDMVYFDTSLLIIHNTTFTISSDGAIFNLMIFLNEFPDSKGYDAVQSLEFTGRTVLGNQEETALALFEKGEFAPNATELLRRCPNVKNISLILSLNDLPWTLREGGQAASIAQLTKKYDIASILHLNQLELITLSLKPFMALEKKMKAMEEKTKMAQLKGFEGSGLEGFWGLKYWFEMQALDHMKFIEVRCPSLEQLA